MKASFSRQSTAIYCKSDSALWTHDVLTRAGTCVEDDDRSPTTRITIGRGSASVGSLRFLAIPLRLARQARGASSGDGVVCGGTVHEGAVPTGYRCRAGGNSHPIPDNSPPWTSSIQRRLPVAARKPSGCVVGAKIAIATGCSSTANMSNTPMPAAASLGLGDRGSGQNTREETG
jgi:hypothetical protein